jgi:hypothetical protein
MSTTEISRDVSTTPIVYIKQDSDGIFHYSNDNSLWTKIENTKLRLLIINTPLSTSVLTVRFETDLTITTNNNLWFDIGSDNITIDGNFKNVTITDVTGYSGLIQNGTSGINGKDNITVKNINTHSSGSSALTNGGGWICRSYFGKGPLTNTIESCSNAGAISGANSGGICGQYAGSGSGTCSLTNCYNTGVVSGDYAGGICGYGAGVGSGNCTLTNCYNTGAVSSTSSGGICGSNAGTSGNCTLTNCYNTGAVSGISTGGICGPNAGNYGTCSLTNCYTLYTPLSTTTVATSGTTGFFTVNCYNANGTWSDSDANGNGKLSGVPISGYNFGSVWVSVSPGTPYFLASFNKEIYSNKTITNVQKPYTSSVGLFPSPYKYKIIDVNSINVIDSNISINDSTGAITFGSSITDGTYIVNVFVYNGNLSSAPGSISGYNFNYLSVGVMDVPISPVLPISSICFLGDTLITTDQGECRIDEIDVTYHTLDGNPILKITQTRSIDNHLVSFGKDSLGLNIPSRCTVMTKGHSLLYNGVLTQARNFLNVFDNVCEVPYNNEIVYNVLMDSAGTMKVNNLICETLNPRHFMGNLLIYLDGLNESERNDLLLCYNDYLKVNKCLPNALYYENGRHIFAGLKSS